MSSKSLPTPAPKGAESRTPNLAPASGSGLSRRGTLLLSLIGLTVFTVTILRIDRFVLAENHRDAPITGRILTRGLEESEIGTLASLLQDERLSRQLVDHRLHQDGRVLERFGYLFRLTENTPLCDGAAFLAWPVQAGRTGRNVFLMSLAGETWMHPNENLEWSGLAVTPDPSVRGWSHQTN